MTNVFNFHVVNLILEMRWQLSILRDYIVEFGFIKIQVSFFYRRNVRISRFFRKMKWYLIQINDVVITFRVRKIEY